MNEGAARVQSLAMIFLGVVMLFQGKDTAAASFWIAAGVFAVAAAIESRKS